MDSPSLQSAFEATRQKTLERHRAHINPLFVPTLQKLNLDRLFVRAEGTRLWDDNGTEYLDLKKQQLRSRERRPQPSPIDSCTAGLLRTANPDLLQIGTATRHQCFG